jgi:hypothetical protein
MSPLMSILDEARWAPSGDNTQPWLFEPRGEREVVVHGRDTRAHCVYDLRGEASQLSIGTMLETMAIAATRHGWIARCSRRESMPETQPSFDIRFDDGAAALDPLADCIQRRAVQRRPLSTRRLTGAESQAMERSAGPGWRVRWFQEPAERWQCARLMFHNAHLRLTMPEAYLVHRDIIEWHARESVDRVPDQALGSDPLGLLMMRIAMKSWKRVQFANRFLAGTWLPRLQMDLLPGWACAAHLVLIAERPPQSIDDFVAAGRAVQRVWLTATQLGLWQQPQMTPLIFARYARQGVRFTAVESLQRKGADIAGRIEGLLGADAERAVWMGRIGEGRAPTARSVRKPLAELLLDTSAAAARLTS